MEAGDRLPKPRFSSQQIFDLMLLCWKAHPEHRPKFKLLWGFIKVTYCSYINSNTTLLVFRSFHGNVNSSGVYNKCCGCSRISLSRWSGSAGSFGRWQGSGYWQCVSDRYLIRYFKDARSAVIHFDSFLSEASLGSAKVKEHAVLEHFSVLVCL